MPRICTCLFWDFPIITLLILVPLMWKYSSTILKIHLKRIWRQLRQITFHLNLRVLRGPDRFILCPRQVWAWMCLRQSCHSWPLEIHLTPSLCFVFLPSEIEPRWPVRSNITCCPLIFLLMLLHLVTGLPFCPLIPDHTPWVLQQVAYAHILYSSLTACLSRTYSCQ